jgi:hypothetical protein
MMPAFHEIRHHIVELVVVFVGVALAFAVENLREDLNERAVGEQYLAGFRADLLADREMLDSQKESRRDQLQKALAVLKFFEGQSIRSSSSRRTIQQYSTFTRFLIATLWMRC